MKLKKVLETLNSILQGKEKAIKLSLICLLAKGHLLIEDLPGVGKTTLALAISRVFGLSFGRIQGTSDLLPSDITGTTVYHKKTESFKFHKGPIFNHIVLVDEINRMSPKTQSALLEPMEENQVTVDGITYPLPQPFFLIATQNPIEYHGTYPLPEAQIDRFFMKISIGYPSKNLEKEILKIGSLKDSIINLEPIMDKDELIRAQKEVNQVYVSEKIIDYVLDIVEATRKNPYLLAGLSTRGALILIQVAKAKAYLEGRDFVIPEDIKDIALYTTPYRLIPKDENMINRTKIVEEILQKIKIPV